MLFPIDERGRTFNAHGAEVKLTPAMVRLVNALNQYGYVDPVRDLGRHTTSGTIVALMSRGVLREAGTGSQHRHYPATTPEQVWDEAHSMHNAAVGRPCVRTDGSHVNHDEAVDGMNCDPYDPTAEDKRVTAAQRKVFGSPARRPGTVHAGSPTRFEEVEPRPGPRTVALRKASAQAAGAVTPERAAKVREVVDATLWSANAPTDLPCLAMTGDKRYSGGLRAANGHDHLLATGPECNDAWPVPDMLTPAERANVEACKTGVAFPAPLEKRFADMTHGELRTLVRRLGQPVGDATWNQLAVIAERAEAQGLVTQPENTDDGDPASTLADDVAALRALVMKMGRWDSPPLRGDMLACLDRIAATVERPAVDPAHVAQVARFQFGQVLAVEGIPCLSNPASRRFERAIEHIEQVADGR